MKQIAFSEVFRLRLILVCGCKPIFRACGFKTAIFLAKFGVRFNFKINGRNRNFFQMKAKQRKKILKIAQFSDFPLISQKLTKSQLSISFSHCSMIPAISNRDLPCKLNISKHVQVTKYLKVES